MCDGPWLMRRVPQDNGAERLVPLAEIIGGLQDAGARIVRHERLGLLPEFVPKSLMPPAKALERARGRGDARVASLLRP